MNEKLETAIDSIKRQVYLITAYTTGVSFTEVTELQDVLEYASKHIQDMVEYATLADEIVMRQKELDNLKDVLVELRTNIIAGVENV